MEEIRAHVPLDFQEWSKYIVYETPSSMRKAHLFFEFATGFLDVVHPLHLFLHDCVEVGNAPIYAIPYLKLIKILINWEILFLEILVCTNFDADLWKIKDFFSDLNILLAQSLSALHVSLFVLVKHLCPHIMKVSHTIVRRPTRKWSEFEMRLQNQIIALNLRLMKLASMKPYLPTAEIEKYIRECIFLSSVYVREGKDDRHRDERNYAIYLREQAIINSKTEEKHVSFAPIEFLSPELNNESPRSPPASCSCFKRKH